MKKRAATRGFTLVELLIVIAIIGVLSAVAAASFTNAVKNGANAKRNSDIQGYAAALEAYYGRYYSYPYVTVGDNSTFYCLGTYTGNACWGGGNYENAALDAAIKEFDWGLPGGTKVSSWTGYVYRCERFTGSKCTQYRIFWFLDKPNQTCGGETVYDPNYTNLGITFCEIIRS